MQKLKRDKLILTYKFTEKALSNAVYHCAYNIRERLRIVWNEIGLRL
jgi:hypothetical protein